MRGSEALAFRGVQRGFSQQALRQKELWQKELWQADGPVLDREPSTDAWHLDNLFGRLVELSGSAAGAVLTVAFRLVREAQQRGEPVAWITGHERTFFPPDVAEGGVDLAALAVVRLPILPQAVLFQAPRAADPLVRSGGFGLLVMDLGVNAELPIATQSRLAGLAKRHHAALLCLTRKPCEAPSLGSLVSLRGEVLRGEVLREGVGSARVGVTRTGLMKPGRAAAAEEEGRGEWRDEPVGGERSVGCYRLVVRTLKRKGAVAFAEARATAPPVASAKADRATEAASAPCEELCHAPDGLC